MRDSRLKAHSKNCQTVSKPTMWKSSNSSSRSEANRLILISISWSSSFRSRMISQRTCLILTLSYHLWSVIFVSLLSSTGMIAWITLFKTWQNSQIMAASLKMLAEISKASLLKARRARTWPNKSLLSLRDGSKLRVDSRRKKMLKNYLPFHWKLKTYLTKSKLFTCLCSTLRAIMPPEKLFRNLLQGKEAEVQSASAIPS